MSDDGLPIFIHSDLDDAGLDPYEFRLYARYVRRAGTDGVCYEAHSSMADDLQMDERTLRDARDGLERRGMIDVESRPGTTDIVTPHPVESWDTDASAQTVMPETTPKNGTAHKNDTGHIYEGGTTLINAPAPAPKMGEGTLRYSNKDTPLEGQLARVCVGEEERDGEVAQDEEPTQGDALPLEYLAETSPPVADVQTAGTPDDQHQAASGAGTGDGGDDTRDLDKLRAISDGEVPKPTVERYARQLDDHWAVRMYEKYTEEDLTAIQKEEIEHKVDDPSRWAETILTVLIDDWKTYSVKNKLRYYENSATSKTGKVAPAIDGYIDRGYSPGRPP